MTITSYPFENQDTSESQFSRLFRELQDTGIAAEIGALDFRVTASGTDLTLTLAPGFAIVRGHAVDSTAIESIQLDPATSTPRIDRVVLRLDPSSNSVLPVVIKGTPGNTPVTPPLTQTDTGTFDYPLASVAVGAAALSISESNVTDERRFVGSRVGAWTTVTRPVPARKGHFGYNDSTSVWEFWDGVKWDLLVDSSGLLPKTGKAADSDKLDGLDSTDFLRATGKAVDADKLDGLDSTAFLRTTGKAADSELLDGIDSGTFARRDQAVNFAGAISEAGQRVYSPNNPPPPGGAVIVKTVRGTVMVGTPATIPAVDMAKAQLRFLGVTTLSTSTTASGSGFRVELTDSTTVTAYNAAGLAGPVGYEITEWS